MFRNVFAQGADWICGVNISRAKILDRVFLQPRQHIAGIPVGRKHRIEHMGDARIVDDQRQSLDQVSPATSIVGKSSARVSASFSSDKTGNGRCSREAISVWYVVALRRQAEHVPGARGLQFREQIAERTGLRRAAARAGDHVPVVDQAILPGSPVLG